MLPRVQFSALLIPGISAYAVQGRDDIGGLVVLMWWTTLCLTGWSAEQACVTPDSRARYGLDGLCWGRAIPRDGGELEDERPLTWRLVVESARVC